MREREEKDTAVRAAGVLLWLVSCKIRGQKVPSDSNGCNTTIDRSLPGLHKHWPWLPKALWEDMQSFPVLFPSTPPEYLACSLLVGAGDFLMERPLLVSDAASIKQSTSNHVQSSSSLPCQSSYTAMQNDEVLAMQPQAFEDGGSFTLTHETVTAVMGDTSTASRRERTVQGWKLPQPDFDKDDLSNVQITHDCPCVRGQASSL